MGMKVVVTTLVTVRCRIVSGQFRPIKEDGENAAMGFLINYVFKALLLVCPLGAGEAGGAALVEDNGEDPTLAAWLGVHRNATEQEPWFVALAFAYSLISDGESSLYTTTATALVYAYLSCRLVHMLCYACHIQPLRTVAFVSGLVTTLVSAVALLSLSAQHWKELVPYKRALACLISGLAIKLVLTTLITVRCRIVSGQFRPIKEDGESAAMGFLINYVFKGLLFVCPLGPGQDAGMHLVDGGGQDTSLDAWLGIHRNATEQEPWFLALACVFACDTFGHGASWIASLSTSALYVYLACRLVHMLCYACRIQPFRTITFVSGLVTTLLFGSLLLFVGIQRV